jgi:hypothetical protein
MSGRQFTISQARLEKAKSINDRDWLESTFNAAARVIDSGGKVKIMQPFSAAAHDNDAIIENREMLNYYRNMYFR